MSPQTNITQAEHLAKIDELVRARMVEQKIPGLSLAALRNGVPLLLQGYGFANLELNVPTTPDTLYEIASVSKQFLATALALLAEEGSLTLDDPITGYFRNAPAAWQSITIRHLLTHSSGIVRDGLEGYWDDPDAKHLDYEYPQMYAIIAGRELDFPTGEKISYSNSGYFLLGLIVEQVTKQSLNEVLTKRIFAPLGMNATRINDPFAILPNRASGYLPVDAAGDEDNRKNKGESKWRKPPYVGLRHHFANGGLVSTVTDLAKWDAALYGEQVLPKARLQEMWTPYQLNDGTPTDRGLGWIISNFEGHRQIHHGGLLPGFTANISRFVDDGLTVIVLANSQFDWSSTVPALLAKDIAKILF